MTEQEWRDTGETFYGWLLKKKSWACIDAKDMLWLWNKYYKEYWEFVLSHSVNAEEVRDIERDAAYQILGEAYSEINKRGQEC